jgi:hypothetical protein
LKCGARRSIPEQNAAANPITSIDRDDPPMLTGTRLTPGNHVVVG